MISILIYILILCLIFGLVFWIIDVIPIPAPFNRIAKAIIGVILLLILIDMLLGGRFVGLPVYRP